MKISKIFKPFPSTVSKEQCTGTGMAVVLIILIFGSYLEDVLLFKIAIPVLFITMAIPMLFYPLAIIWFGISNILGVIMPKVILAIIFLIVVIPVAFFRKVIGKDSLLLRLWKSSSESVFKDREHIFVPADLEKPY
jgi:predicted permease